MNEPRCETDNDPTRMARRRFLQAVGAAGGLTALMGPEALPAGAATAPGAGLTPQETAAEESLWAETQQAFTMTRSLVNLDNGFTCPCPRAVSEAVAGYIRAQEELPYALWLRNARERTAGVRTGLAQLFGTDPEQIAVTRNATEALKTVLNGFPLKPGEEILTSTHDYDSMLELLDQRERKDAIRVIKAVVPILPATMDELAGIFERAITPRTRLILASHMTYTTGQIFPIRAICEIAHRRGIDVIVDGAHAFGQLDFKLADLGCDYYATSLHKWLLAPKGTGMLFVRKDRIGTIPPLYGPVSEAAGGAIRKFESVGVQDSSRVLGIGDALAFHNAIGARRKEERLRYLKNYWAERLRRLPNIRLYTPLEPEASCGIAAVGIEAVDPTALHDYLWDAHRIHTSRGYYEAGGKMRFLRISPNLYTTLKELDYFCAVMERVAASGLPEPYRSFKPDPGRFLR
jgi:selenocysteine lyase/cysteine desulfurase